LGGGVIKPLEKNILGARGEVRIRIWGEGVREEVF